MRLTCRLILVALPALVLGGCQSSPKFDCGERKGIADSRMCFPAKDFKTGTEAMIADHQGKAKVIFLDLWSSRSTFCRKTIPFAKRIQRLAKPGDVQVIGLNTLDTEINANLIQDELQMPYPLLRDEKAKENSFSAVMGAEGFPQVYILDGQSLKVLGSWSGYAPENEKAQVRLMQDLGVTFTEDPIQL